MGWKAVQAQVSEKYDERVEVSLRDVETGVEQTITTTLTHPFFVQTTRQVAHASEGHVYAGPLADGYWIDAADLRAGDRLLNDDSSWAEVVSSRTLAQPLRAYNLTVKDFHTYFVAANKNAAPVWVHNDCPKFTAALRLLERADMGEKELAELASALKFQREFGIKLRWAPRDGPDGDFIDATGKLWDVMGTKKAYEYWNPSDFFRAIDHHINKQGVNTVIDLRGATAAQIDMVLDHVASKPSQVADSIKFLY